MHLPLPSLTMYLLRELLQVFPDILNKVPIATPLAKRMSEVLFFLENFMYKWVSKHFTHVVDCCWKSGVWMGTSPSCDFQPCSFWQK